MMTLTKAMGVLALSKKNAIEELAGDDTLCSDKTGTLTWNQLTPSDPIPFGTADAPAIILGGALACHAVVPGLAGTQVFVVVMCGPGRFLTAIPWTFIALVWLCMLVWMFVLDLVKPALYRKLDQG